MLVSHPVIFPVPSAGSDNNRERSLGQKVGPQLGDDSGISPALCLTSNYYGKEVKLLTCVTHCSCSIYTVCLPPSFTDIRSTLWYEDSHACSLSFTGFSTNKFLAQRASAFVCLLEDPANTVTVVSSPPGIKNHLLWHSITLLSLRIPWATCL